MTKEQLKAYLDSKKMDAVDSAFDASIDILVFIVNQDAGINLNNSCAQQCIALAGKGRGEAMNELVRSSAIDMSKAEKISFYGKILQNISDFCSLGKSLISLKSNIEDYYRGNADSAGDILGSTLSALSVITGTISGPIGSIISTQLGIAGDLAGEASTIVSKYKERYEQYENIDKKTTSSSEYASLKEEFEEMKKSATESKESFNLFKTFINKYRQLLSALGCDLSALDNQIRETESYYTGQNSISDYESKMSGIFSNSSLTEDYKSYLNKDDVNGAEKSQKYDPLIIDLDGDGIYTKARESGVYFDFDGDGFKEKTAWVDDGDGMLVYDRNGNGVIDNGGELFGDKTILSNGRFAANGFEALAELDSNGDSIISNEDEVFNQLRVWIDKNSDGISQTDELFTLDELGIESISLGKKVSNKTENGGNIVISTATINYKDNTKGEIGEIQFDIDSMDTINELVSSIRSEITDNMPQIFVTGNMLNLQEAMEHDDRLYNMVKGFTTSNDLYSLKNLTTEIIYRWAGVENVKDGSRGAYVDAKELAVIEKFYGKGFVGINGVNPNNTAGPILTKVYDKLFDSIYYGLLSQTVLKDYYGLISVKNYIVSGEKKLDCSRAMEKIEKELSVNYKDTITKLVMFLGALENSSNTSSMYNRDEIVESCKNSKYIEEIKYACNGNVIYASENSDKVNGTSSDDLIIGTNNSGSLYGGAGDDLLAGGEGDDYMSGGAGNDTYIVGIGTGHDRIYDAYGSNTIRFTDGVRPEDLIATYGSNGSVILTNRNSGDSVELSEFRHGSSYRGYVMVFDDGTIMEMDDERSPLRNLEGTEGDDVLSAFYSGIKYHAGGGNDEINGSSGNDEMYGEEGNDKLYGGAGDDLLVGGEGDDYMSGGAGNDTYIVGIGTGHDRIYDAYGSNTIRFTDGVRPEDLIATYGSNGSVILTNRNSGDSVELSEFRHGSSYRGYELVFDDGRTATVSSSELKLIYEELQEDVLSTWCGADNTQSNGVYGVDTYTDLQATLLAQELSALSDSNNICSRENIITAAQSELFTEQFTVQ